MKNFSSIVITGASSGIGEALALDYARPGVALALTGRDAGRLEAVAAACRAKGATVVADTVDVVDRETFARWLTTFDDAHPVDLVVANAGISIDKDNSSLDDFSTIRRTFDVVASYCHSRPLFCFMTPWTRQLPAIADTQMGPAAGAKLDKPALEEKMRQLEEKISLPVIDIMDTGKDHLILTAIQDAFSGCASC